MAIWQFDCMIISNKKVHMETKADEILSWKDIELPMNFKEMVGEILPLTKGWSDEILQYGEVDSTCIEIFLESKEIEEIILRLDLRNLTKKTLEKIIELVSKINGKILYNEKIYQADMKIIVPLMKESNAGKFSMDQEKYFEELAQNSQSELD